MSWGWSGLQGLGAQGGPTWWVEVFALLAGGLLMLSVLSATLLAHAPRERHLGPFAGLSACWAMLVLQGIGSLPLESVALRDGLMVLLWAAACSSFMRFAQTYAALESRLLQRLAPTPLMTVPIVVAAAPTAYRAAACAIAALWSAGLAVFAAAHFMRLMDQTRIRPMKAMGLTMMAGVALVAAALPAGWVGVESLSHLNTILLHGAVPACLAIMGVLQMTHFGQQVSQLESVQRSLEQRMERTRSEIEANFSQLAEARIQQVTAGERKRIATDLHDDLGAKLLTIVHTSRSDRIAALGREALDEMRLSVRGLTGRPMELSEALADWRTEAMARLSATGIDLDWPLPQDELPQVLGSRTMVQTTRILREVFNNLIRHSQAQRCEVSTQVEPERLSIEVRDNGIGFDTERLRDGHHGLGLLSMAHRARQLQGDCVIESRLGGGSRVKLTLPLNDSAA